MQDFGLSGVQQDQLWARWQAGESLRSVGRGVGIRPEYARRFVARTGGIRPSIRRRSARHLSLVEREEISGGIAGGDSARMIAVRLGRSASSMSREIARNGGRSGYRATPADTAAWDRTRRPQLAKLARHPALRQAVEAKLSQRWSPQQISAWLHAGPA